MFIRLIFACFALSSAFAQAPVQYSKWSAGNFGLEPSNSPALVTYTPSMEDFANPERGFYHYSETHSTNYTPLDAAELASWRNLHQPGGAAYSIYSTLVFRYFVLENFTNSPISNAYLNAVAQDFAAARQAGVKLIPRFAYTLETNNGGCDYCPPYGDASKSRVLQHIAQLKPILQANADVLATLQLGFIGIWGEGYYTDFFGDDSQPPYGLTAQNWNDRSELIAALLDALPADRAVQVRYPQMKQKTVYGAGASTSAAPMTPAEAFQNTAKARIGFHNDCFLSSDSDVGTYINFDIVNDEFDTTHLKPYFAADSRFVPVGGETCEDWNPYSNCNGQPGGGAQQEMARMHWSFLNADYNNALNNDWVNGGCIDEIKQRLGYRLELQQGMFPTEAPAGQSISIKIDLKNKGFAAPFNPRKLRLVLRHTLSNAVHIIDLPGDPRTWLPGNQTYSIEHSFTLPADLPAGAYDLLLQLADPYPALTNRPEYTIRLANQGLWEAATGFNKLQAQLTVTACVPPVVVITHTGSTQFCAGETVLLQAADNSLASYQWYRNDTLLTLATQSMLVTDISGSYTVYATNAGGCGSFSNAITLTVSPIPAITLTSSDSDGQLCAGEALWLHGDGGLVYSWNLGDGSEFSGQDIQIPAVDETHTGIYTLTITDASGCTNNAYFACTVHPLPVVELSGLEPTYTESDPVANLTGTPPGGVFSGQGVMSGQFLPGNAGVGEHSIVYTFTDVFGCTGADTVLVTVTPVVGTVELPGIASLQVLPNPNAGYFRLEIRSDNAYALNMQLADVMGHVITTQTSEIAAGVTQIPFDSRLLANGMYFLHVMLGAEQVVFRIVVAR